MDSPCTDTSFEPTAETRTRADRQHEERCWTRIAADHWLHRRSLHEVLEESARRGDRVAVDVANFRILGAVLDVADDVVRLDRGARPVDIPLRSAAGAPVVGVVQRFASPGCRPRRALGSWRARLLECEASRHRVELGLVAGAVVIGRLVVARDHLVVTAGAEELFVPVDAVAYLGAGPSGPAGASA